MTSSQPWGAPPSLASFPYLLPWQGPTATASHRLEGQLPRHVPTHWPLPFFSLCCSWLSRASVPPFFGARARTPFLHRQGEGLSRPTVNSTTANSLPRRRRRTVLCLSAATRLPPNFPPVLSLPFFLLCPSGLLLPALLVFHPTPFFSFLQFPFLEGIGLVSLP